MCAALLDKGEVAFSSEGRLLQELGLRLVASPEVALVELIKNAYDADSPDCVVRVVDNDTLVIEDSGHGMTLDDFNTKWMRVATSSKLRSDSSPRFHRPLTGAKGIGRFAVRYLGDELTLESTAQDTARGTMTTLRADFNWPRLDAVADLSRTKVPYTLTAADRGSRTGTRMTIRKLRIASDFTRSATLRTDVLRIVSPIQGLESGSYGRSDTRTTSDPGFRVILPGDEPTHDENLAALLLGHYWARLEIRHEKSLVTFTVTTQRRTKPSVLKVKVADPLQHGFYADIRFFPRRKGVFQGKSIDGRKAWTWVREKSGIAVVDHGFRIKPYGFPDDDWLWLDLDAAHNERNWRTDIAKTHFPIAEEIRSRPGENPALNLPHNSQLVGAVFIQTARGDNATHSSALVPAMDREGLLGNEAFSTLRELTRAGIEFLALCDKHELNRLAEQDAKKAAEAAREDVRRAIESIQESETLTRSDKSRLVKQYADLAERLEEHEEYSAKARSSLLTMGLLGVIAGFMTHESDAMLHELEQASRQLNSLAHKNESLQDAADEIARRLGRLRGYLAYSRLFISKAGGDKSPTFTAAGQIRHIVSRFESFANDRGIGVAIEVSRDVQGPSVPITAYSGILLNLFTNALKALVSVQSSVKNPRVVFRGWNEGNKHIVEVLDNGPGIPLDLRKRIWDPLYTTTADPANPLGSGMGLGLTLVKQVVTELQGSINLVQEVPVGFTTCFRVTLPLK